MSSFPRLDVFAREPWYALADRLADVGDHKAFHLDCEDESLEQFEPMVTRVLARAKSI